MSEEWLLKEGYVDNIDNYDKMSVQEKWYILAMVANLYYNGNFTQSQIANRIFTSRSKVSRLLKEAREMGLVEIYIREPWERELWYEQKMKEQFDLTMIRVMKNKKTDKTDELARLGEVAAYYLDSVVKKDVVIGVSWGNTLYRIVNHISKMNRKNIPITVVPIMGAGHVRNSEQDVLDLARNLAQAYGGKYKYLYAPLFVNNEEIRKSLVQEEHIREVLDMARNAQIMLSSVGSVADRSWSNYLRADVWKTLESKGAVGYIGGHFYDINGCEIRTQLQSRMIGVELEDMIRCRDMICVAYGAVKADAVLGALRGKFVNTLIIDESCAEKLMEKLQ